jgi:hypothetical protein
MAAMFALAASVSPAAGVPIAIVNSGFETDPVSEGCFAVFTPFGWQPYDPFDLLNGGNNSIGVLDCTDWIFFPDGAPEGVQVALTFLAATIGAGPAGLSQVLADVLEASTIYRLTVQVGNIASGTGPPPCDQFGFFDLDGFPGYRVELLAGGVVIAADDNSLAGVLGEGEFGPTAIRAAIPATHAQLGQPLEIRLINLNEAETPEDPGIEVDFDDVALEATPVGPAELLELAQCLSGPDAASTCDPGFAAAFDFDDDGDLDLADFAAAATLP